MKTLYLIRHAKSDWDDIFQDDFDRPLSARGRRDAPAMGKRLREMEVHPDMLISSPAERAISTCLIIAEKIGYPLTNVHADQRLYHADDETLLNIVNELNDANDEVMLFAHNPGLTDFANRLTTHPFTDNLPTCAIVSLRFSVDSWVDVYWGKGTLLRYDFPKKAQP